MMEQESPWSAVLRLQWRGRSIREVSFYLAIALSMDDACAQVVAMPFGCVLVCFREVTAVAAHVP